MNNHTPGPWTKTLRNGQYRIHGLYRNKTVCRTSGGDATNQANANLVAAAPDLLKVAVRFERLLVKMGLPIDGKGNKELSLVRDAIAKATGSNDPPDVA